MSQAVNLLLRAVCVHRGRAGHHLSVHTWALLFYMRNQLTLRLSNIAFLDHAALGL